jgi:hypothetical protein
LGAIKSGHYQPDLRRNMGWGGILGSSPLETENVIENCGDGAFAMSLARLPRCFSASLVLLIASVCVE